MDRKSIDFDRHWAKRYVHEHHPYGLDESDVENMILRRLHYNKDKGERGRKAALVTTPADSSHTIGVVGFGVPFGIQVNK